MVAKINVDIEEFKRLYAEGMNDKEIAGPPGLSEINRAGYGQKDRIPDKQQLKQQLEKQKKEHENRLELYNKGLSDTQIAVELGEKKSTITQWRRKNNLPLPPKINETEFLEHYQQGKRTKEIADELHVNYNYLRRWMRKHNYKVNRPKFVRKAMMLAHKQLELETKPEKRLELYNKGLSDTEIAAGTGEPKDIPAQLYKNKLPHSTNPENTKNNKLTRVTISVPKALLADFNEFTKIKGNSTYSEVVRNAIRKYIFDYEEINDIESHYAGTASIVYNHTKHGLSDTLVDIQHNYSHLIRFSTYI